VGNKIVHAEVVGKDGPALHKFWGELFGWKQNTDFPGGYGMTDAADSGIVLGTGPAPDGGGGWVTFYVSVSDVDATLAKAQALGGTVAHTGSREYGRTVLTAQGGSTVRGLPNMSGPSPAQAAQRNYLQALHAEVADKGVYVGMLYIGAIIENSAFHTQTQQAKATGAGRDWGPTVDPAHLADLLWSMHRTKSPAEPIYPEPRFDG